MKILANDGLNQSGIEALEQKGFEVITSKVPQDELVNYINENIIEFCIMKFLDRSPYIDKDNAVIVLIAL